MVSQMYKTFGVIGRSQYDLIFLCDFQFECIEILAPTSAFIVCRVSPCINALQTTNLWLGVCFLPLSILNFVNKFSNKELDFK